MNKEPESTTEKEWAYNELKCKVIFVRQSHRCGYVTFPKRPFREQGYDGILTYVPVHGGITYAHEEKDGSFTYGFDCAHSGDKTLNPYRSFDSIDHFWATEEVVAETEKLARSLQVAIKYEKRYLTNISNKGKAKVLDEYHKALVRGTN